VIASMRIESNEVLVALHVASMPQSADPTKG
jgi:hypothetical protein